MSRQCNFCDRWFGNKQAVRAHLKHCGPYRAARADGTSPPSKRYVDKTFYRCASCQNFETEVEEVHRLYTTGCPWCGCREWYDLGTHKVPITDD